MAAGLSMGVRNSLLEKIRADFTNCVIGVYGGTMPADANTTENATLLALITEGGGEFTGGVATNGLNFDAAADGSMSKAAAETWSGAVLATGTATWVRIYDNNYVTGASTTEKRIDLPVSTTTATEVRMSQTSLTAGGTATIDSAVITKG